MNPKKSPGPDGWTAGFFQLDPVVFSEILLLVFNYQLTHHGQLLPKQRESAIALLFKAGDRGNPGSYRPIALMPVEAKVLSRALAYRLASYSPQLIRPTQAGFPLGAMLREKTHLGIALPHGETITSLFFADDSTLLSNSLQDAVEQMEIVERFCEVSGAKLNQSKCMTLVLNNHLDPNDIEAEGLLNILASGQPVKYLGILFGHMLPTEFQVKHLNDKFLECFQHWGCRARTLQGRKLLVNTVMLSLLWHVTTVLPIPEPAGQGWQSKLNKFVLGRKTGPRPSSASDLAIRSCTSTGSATCVGQDPGTATSATTTPYGVDVDYFTTVAAPCSTSIRRTLAKLYRDTHPFDFLLYHPNTSSKWLCLWELHTLWRDIWAQWAAIPMKERMPMVPNLSTAMAMPYDAMRNHNNAGADILPHPFVAMVKDNVQPFQRWPRRLIIDLACHAPSVVVQHPMASTQRSTDADLKRYVRLVRRTCRKPPSLQADVWLRLLYNMLPVNSRFYYLQVAQPTAVCCAYGCGAVEAQLHAFHQCSHINHVWQFHARAWQCYGVNFEWSTVSNLDNFGVNHRGVELKSAIFLVWSPLTATVLHKIWTQHNAIQYNNKAPLPETTWYELTFLGWTTLVRRWLRLQDADSTDRQPVLDVLEMLSSQPHYRALWAKYPRCLSLQPPSLAL
ncbi:hypothetical protein THRCLA_10092 [Thraustotheca clavata]|uniref:Uncharacterized protein n=1 Tax=Thraustotheca clavata TaxID=74557 RepID=A0A1V9YTA3_9STRA|nr:hypothetical protein THRCLA_10092 [Thraustotheca clavata]